MVDAALFAAVTLISRSLACPVPALEPPPFVFPWLLEHADNNRATVNINGISLRNFLILSKNMSSLNPNFNVIIPRKHFYYQILIFTALSLQSIKGIKDLIGKALLKCIYVKLKKSEKNCIPLYIV
jgi:hypothetical protein